MSGEPCTGSGHPSTNRKSVSRYTQSTTVHQPSCTDNNRPPVVIHCAPVIHHYSLHQLRSTVHFPPLVIHDPSVHQSSPVPHGIHSQPSSTAVHRPSLPVYRPSLAVHRPSLVHRPSPSTIPGDARRRVASGGGGGGGGAHQPPTCAGYPLCRDGVKRARPCSAPTGHSARARARRGCPAVVRDGVQQAGP